MVTNANFALNREVVISSIAVVAFERNLRLSTSSLDIRKAHWNPQDDARPTIYLIAKGGCQDVFPDC